MAVTTQSSGAARRRFAAALSAAVAILLLGLVGTLAQAAGGAKGTKGAKGTDIALGRGSVTGLPVPRFVSLKADRINVRSGPSRDQDVQWVYTRAGMPVEITAEFENWRRIRDWQGAEGWVYHSLLSGKRTGVVVPALKDRPGTSLRPGGRQVRSGSAPPGRRAGPARLVHWHLVRVQRQGLRRLDPADPVVGRLSEREGRRLIHLFGRVGTNRVGGNRNGRGIGVLKERRSSNSYARP